MTVSRRGFLRSIAAMAAAPAAAIGAMDAIEKPNRSPVISSWKNYTCVYSPIDKEVLIQRMRNALREGRFSTTRGIIL